jgi:hypothetical protein
MFQKLCGADSLPSVVFATTMWDNVKESVGEQREDELKTRPDFWGDMASHGSRVFRHEDSRASAMNIVTYILDQRRTAVLQIQRQMVDEGKSLDETAAGQEVERELLKQREHFEKRLKEAQEEMNEAIEEGNRHAIEEAAEDRARFQKKIDALSKGSADIKISMQKLLEQKEAEVSQAIRDLQLARQKRLDDTKKQEKRVEELEKLLKNQDKEREGDRQKQLKERDELTLQLSKQYMESQQSLQRWISEQDRHSVQEVQVHTPSVSVPEPTASSTPQGFRETFKPAAANSLGLAVGTIAISAASTITQNACVVM